MSRHSFDPEIAGRVGLNAAVIFQNIIFWIEKNQANRRNLRDGRYWTYNSISAFGKHFPYLSEKQIRTTLENMVRRQRRMIISFFSTGTGGGAASVEYLTAREVLVYDENRNFIRDDAGQPQIKIRDPLPEVLHGNPDQTRGLIDASPNGSQILGLGKTPAQWVEVMAGIRRYIVGDEPSKTFSDTIMLYNASPKAAKPLIPMVEAIGDLSLSVISGALLKGLGPMLKPKVSTDSAHPRSNQSEVWKMVREQSRELGVIGLDYDECHTP